jgi:drug/metabolite transporter (DMT)-like permease
VKQARPYRVRAGLAPALGVAWAEILRSAAPALVYNTWSHMGIFLGLAAALCWGAADFLARSLTQVIGTYRTLFFMQFIGAFVLTIYVLSSGELMRLAHHTAWQPWLWAVVVAMMNAFCALALYRSFEVGVLSIVSPVAASSSALTVVLSFLSGETISQARAFGIGAALAGVVLAATHFSSISHSDTPGKTTRKGRLARGVGWALVASVSYGINFWLLGFFVTPSLGGSVPIWIIRLGTISTLALCAAPVRQSIRLPRGRVWWLILLVGTLDTCAYLLANFGFTTEQVAVVSVLASLFSAVTVLLAWIFLHDKLQWSQWLGIAIIFVGIALVKL